MANQFLENQKKASSLKSVEEKLTADLAKLQEELRFISDAVNKKVQERESVVFQRLTLQEDTSKMVISGRWIEKEKEEPSLVLEPVIETSSLVVPVVVGNPLWNFVKKTWKSVLNFFLEKLNIKNQSATPGSQPDSSTKAS